MATILQSFQVWHINDSLNVGVMQLAIGFLVSALVGIGALKLVLKLLYKAKFRYFSYYVWVLAAVVFISSLRGAL